ncbi:MAG: uroporphyrinogen-III synthase [Trueperaceae bacterium]
MRVALTQSRGRLEVVQEMLETRGYEVVRQPLIETQPLLDEKTRFEAEKLLDCAWILFTSRTAAETWSTLLSPYSTSHIPYPLYGAVGKKTAEALRQSGAEVSIIADQQNAENFADMFLNHQKAASPVGLPRGDRALDTVQQKLEVAGFEVRPLVVYKTVLHPYRFENIEVIVCSSPSAVEAIEDKGEARLVAIGDTTLKAMEARGWQAVKSASPEAEAIVGAIEVNKVRGA